MPFKFAKAALLGASLLCGSAFAHGESDDLKVFTSTNVWGAVIESIAGDKADVIVAVDGLDPHEYEASAHNKLDLSNSKIALINGGGYDDWAIQLAESIDAKPEVINAVEVSAYRSDAKNFNEHVFYSLDTANKVGKVLADSLSEIDPDSAESFANNQKAFASKIVELKALAEASIPKDKKVRAIATEPVIGYLLAEMNIEDITPALYAEQSESDSGPSVQAMKDMLDLINSKTVDLLVLNAQTEDNAAKQLLSAAQSNNIPVVYVYETMVGNANTYEDFIKDTIISIKRALKLS